MTPPTPPVGARLTDEQIALVEARARFKAEHARVCGWPRGAQDECDQEHAVVCELQAHRAAARVSGGDAVERSAENHAFGEPVPQPAAPREAQASGEPRDDLSWLVAERDRLDRERAEHPCPSCGGTGGWSERSDDVPCAACRGTGILASGRSQQASESDIPPSGNPTLSASVSPRARLEHGGRPTSREPTPTAPPMVLRIGDRDVPVEYHDSRPAAQQPAAQEVAPLLQRFNEWAARTRFTRTCKNPVDAGDQMGLREAYALLEEALLASLSRVAPPAPSVEAPDDYEWALARVQLLMASAYADARIHGLKLLKGFGYPDEIMSHAQDYRALSIVLRHLAAIQRAREGAQT